MKKAFLLIALIAITLSNFAQSKIQIHTPFRIPNGYTYASYTGVTSDTLTKNRDTTIFLINLNNPFSCKYALGFGVDTVKGADTTIHYNIYFKCFLPRVANLFLRF